MAYRIIGINDEVTTCECCGRSNLKCTVVLTDGEQEVRFGRDCAAKATRPWCSGLKIETLARKIATGWVEPQAKPYFDAAGKR